MRNPSEFLFRSLLGLCLALGAAGTQASEETGLDILTQLTSRHHVPYEYEALTVKLIDGNGNETVRDMRRYSRKWDEGKYRHLVVFDAPSSVAGTALLAWQSVDGPDHQWTYLPAQGRTRKQNATRGSSRKYFMGTDLTYEDISAEDIDKFQYERQPDQSIGDVAHFVVRARPADPELAKESGYQYRDLFLRKDNYVLVRVDFYDTRGKFIKRMLAKGAPVNIGGQAWRVDHVVLENEKENHRTELIVNERVLGEDAVPKKMFSSQYLDSKRHMK